MLNMVKNASVQATDIYKDPYGYTYSEMVGVLGEVEADKFIANYTPVPKVVTSIKR